jgi:3-isopropylmalate dehydrogenase
MSDKSNALRFGHDLWQRVFIEVATEYPEIETDHLYVDVLAMEMVMNPARLDVIVTCNMFGDIVSDVGAALQGGLGLAGSANIHPGGPMMFEPVHGSAPDIAGKEIANPFAAILCSGSMLQHLGCLRDAARVESAVRQCLSRNECTEDMGGNLGTRAAGDAVVAAL